MSSYHTLYIIWLHSEYKLTTGQTIGQQHCNATYLRDTASPNALFLPLFPFVGPQHQKDEIKFREQKIFPKSFESFAPVTSFSLYLIFPQMAKIKFYPRRPIVLLSSAERITKAFTKRYFIRKKDSPSC